MNRVTAADLNSKLTESVEAEYNSARDVVADRYDQAQKHTVELNEDLQEKAREMTHKIEDFIAEELRGFQSA